MITKSRQFANLINTNSPVELEEKMEFLSHRRLTALEQKLAFTIEVLTSDNLMLARKYHLIVSYLLGNLENEVPTKIVLASISLMEEFIISCELILNIDFQSNEFKHFIQLNYERS